MLHPDTVYFCMAYSAWLGVLSVAALECVHRFRHPLAFFLLGVAALTASFWFALWLEGGLVSAGRESYEAGLPYHYFRRLGFAVFLVFFVVRGGYLLSGAYRRRHHAA